MKTNAKETVQFILQHAREQKELIEKLSEEFKNLSLEDLVLIAKFSLDLNIKSLAHNEIIRITHQYLNPSKPKTTDACANSESQTSESKGNETMEHITNTEWKEAKEVIHLPFSESGFAILEAGDLYKYNDGYLFVIYKNPLYGLKQKIGDNVQDIVYLELDDIESIKTN